MRWPFRRQPAGRHALGPAVTAIPSGPVAPVASASSAPVVPSPAAASIVAVPVTVPVVAVPGAAVRPLPAEPYVEPVEPVQVHAAVPDAPAVQLSSADPVLDLPGLDWSADRPPAHPPLPAGSVPTQPVHVDVVPVQRPPVEPAALPIELLLDLAPVVQAPRPPTSLPGPVAQLPVLHPQTEPAAPVDAGAPPAPHPPPPASPVPSVPDRSGPRVELGFADGTYRMLDPASDTAKALGELVAELTSAPEAPGGNGTPAESSDFR